MKKYGLILIVSLVLAILIVFSLFREPEQTTAHPRPRQAAVYEVCDPLTGEPKIRVYGVLWSDGEWKDLRVFFKEGNAVWRFESSDPHASKDWSVGRYETTDAESSAIVPFSRKECRDPSTIKGVLWKNLEEDR